MNVENQDRERLIDSYILGRMDDASRMEFEKLMEKDEELRDEVSFIKMVKESLDRRSENIQKMKSWEEKMHNIAQYSQTGTDSPVSCPLPTSDTPQPARTVSLTWKRIVSAAACVLLFLGLSYPYSYYGLQDRNFWDQAMRGDMINLSEYIENGQYETALELIDETLEDKLASVPSSDNPDYVISECNYLEWTKIQTLLKMREFERAYDEVAEFRTDAGYYQKKADKLYKKLKLRLRK